MNKRLFESIYNSSVEERKKELYKNIEESFTEDGTGSITVQNWVDPSWSGTFYYYEGYHSPVQDEIFKNGEKPTKKDYKDWKQNPDIEGNFNYIIEIIKEYFKDKLLENEELIDSLKDFYSKGWKIYIFGDEVCFQKNNTLPISLDSILDKVTDHPYVYR